MPGARRKRRSRQCADRPEQELSLRSTLACNLTEGSDLSHVFLIPVSVVSCCCWFPGQAVVQSRIYTGSPFELGRRPYPSIPYLLRASIPLTNATAPFPSSSFAFRAALLLPNAGHNHTPSSVAAQPSWRVAPLSP
jgi:hypothetical protein